MGRYWRTFLPISLSDLLMTLGDPLIIAVLAMLPNSTAHLAAFGLAKAIVVFFESPIIPLLHSSNALSDNKTASLVLRRFAGLFGGGLAMGLLGLASLDAPMAWVASGYDAATQELTRNLVLVLVPWPLVIALRRYWQGRLIHGGQTRPIATAASSRLAVSALLLLACWFPGAEPIWVVGWAMLLSLGVEFTLVFRHGRKTRLPEQPTTRVRLPESTAGLLAYYRPLALSTLFLWGARLSIAVFVAQIGEAAAAIWVTSWALVVSISNGVRMLQQLAIREQDERNVPSLLRFIGLVGILFTGVIYGLAGTAVGGTILSNVFSVSGDSLAQVASLCAVLAPMALFVAIQNGLQGLLMRAGLTKSIGRIAISANSLLMASLALLAQTQQLSLWSVAAMVLGCLLVEVCCLLTVWLRQCAGICAMIGASNMGES